MFAVWNSFNLFEKCTSSRNSANCNCIVFGKFVQKHRWKYNTFCNGLSLTLSIFNIILKDMSSLLLERKMALQTLIENDLPGCPSIEHNLLTIFCKAVNVLRAIKDVRAFDNLKVII
jgi:hypothetical protein